MDVDELFAKHQTELLQYLMRYTGDPDLAADAVQDVYLRLVKSPPRDKEKVRAWLFTVATNVVKDERKRARRVRRFLPAVERAFAPSQPPDPFAAAERAERALLAHQALARVSERERTILLLWVEGFPHKEIAEAVGTTPGTISPTIARALKKLSQQIDQFSREDV